MRNLRTRLEEKKKELPLLIQWGVAAFLAVFWACEKIKGIFQKKRE